MLERTIVAHLEANDEPAVLRHVVGLPLQRQHQTAHLHACLLDPSHAFALFIRQALAEPPPEASILLVELHHAHVALTRQD